MMVNNNANNNYNDDQWCENWEDIPDFQFDNSTSGVKLNIPDSAKDNPIQIFEMLWIRVKLTSRIRPHKKTLSYS